MNTELVQHCHDTHSFAACCCSRRFALAVTLSRMAFTCERSRACCLSQQQSTLSNLHLNCLIL